MQPRHLMLAAGILFLGGVSSLAGTMAVAQQAEKKSAVFIQVAYSGSAPSASSECDGIGYRRGRTMGRLPAPAGGSDTNVAGIVCYD